MQSEIVRNAECLKADLEQIYYKYHDYNKQIKLLKKQASSIETCRDNLEGELSRLLDKFTQGHGELKRIIEDLKKAKSTDTVNRFNGSIIENAINQINLYYLRVKISAD